MRHGKHPRTHSGVEHCGQDASLHKTARSTEFFLAVEASPYPPFIRPRSNRRQPSKSMRRLPISVGCAALPAFPLHPLKADIRIIAGVHRCRPNADSCTAAIDPYSMIYHGRSGCRER